MNFNFIKKKIFCAIVLFCFLAKGAFADERKWVITEPYWTVSQGSFELEEWYNASDSIADPAQNWVELEYGLTDREQVALYEMANQSNFGYRGFKIEDKYRLAQPGDFFLLPAIYLEYANNGGAGEPDGLEGKFILEKYVGNLDVATNFVFEKKLSGNDTAVHFDRFLLAGSYPVGDAFDAGLEYAAYTADHATTITPDLFAEVGHNLRILGGWEIPLTGPYASRLRIEVDWEFNR
jgi:hypothetical protein